MIESIRVALLPALVEPTDLENRQVVVTDVLRATTTICMAIESGAKSVIPTPDIETARRKRTELGTSAILGGERGGIIIDGFDQGNSPREYSTEIVAGKKIVLCTTNGTVAMEVCRSAERVLIGSFVNLTSVAHALSQARHVAIICAGTNRKITSEDVLFAGAVAHQLVQVSPQAELDDQAMIALGHWLAAEQQIQNEKIELWEFLAESLGGRNLMRLGYDEDVRFCGQVDIVNFVPELNLKSWSISIPSPKT